VAPNTTIPRLSAHSITATTMENTAEGRGQWPHYARHERIAYSACVSSHGRHRSPPARSILSKPARRRPARASYADWRRYSASMRTRSTNFAAQLKRHSSRPGPAGGARLRLNEGPRQRHDTQADSPGERRWNLPTPLTFFCLEVVKSYSDYVRYGLPSRI
jgi:hypothetical protein